MSYRVTRLDRRHNGHRFYKYLITPDRIVREENLDLFFGLRNWLWESYGASTELGFTQRNPVWAWDTEHSNRRIYLRGDEELTFFQLKFN